MRRTLTALLMTLTLLWPALTHAASTVAVLPLAKATGSEDYDGLGQALAGMLIADLSGVEALQLVERERLDALLEEMALSESGFLEPSTAQRLGRGVGAELVLTGSYSVVGPTFLMDARLVQVESSHVLKAVKADGTAADFVAVEKDVVEALLAGLEVTLSSAQRRRILIQTPTESFEAFAAYGEGLQRQDEGRIDEARAAFERALTRDPGFEAARTQLAAIRARLEAMRAEDDAREVDDEQRRRLAVLEQTVDERDRPGSHRDSLDDLSRFALRLVVLDELERHCQRYEEMDHFLHRVRGNVDLPPETSEPYVMVENLSKHAWEMGMEEQKYATDTYSHNMRIMDAASPLANPERFLLDLDKAEPGHYKSDSLFKSLSRCHPESEWIPTYERIRTKLRKWGVAQNSYDNHQPTVSLDDQLESFVLQLRVRQRGMDVEVEQRVGVLLDRYEDDTEGRGWAQGVASSIVREADAWERHQVSRQGLPEDVLLGMGRALAEANPKLLRMDVSFCAYAVPLANEGVARDLAKYAEDKDGHRARYAPYTLDSVGIEAAAFMDMGCFAAIPARFANIDEVFDHLDSARERTRADRADTEDCVDSWERWEGHATREQVKSSPNPQVQASMLYYALRSYYSLLVGQRCVESDRQGKE
jgi:TolB-like protein